MRRVSSASSRDPWRTAARLPWADRFLFLEAALRLLIARLVVLVVPFRLLSPRLGRHMAEGRGEAGGDALPRRVRWAIDAVSRRAPWRCKCLEQAIAAKMMLRARGVANTLYMGVARREDSQSGVDAHAWLRCGATFVTGALGHERFAVVSTFADDSASDGR